MLASVLWLAGTACAQDTGDAARPWAVRVPGVEKVVFRGIVPADAAGLGAGAMLYPAPNAAGLLAAILTHGLLIGGAKQAHQDKLQSAADEVLQPYADVLAAMTNEGLLRDALVRQRYLAPKRLVAAADAAPSDWQVETAPVFSMTGDQRALVLDNVVRVYPPGATQPSLAQTIRVVSAPLPDDGASPEPLWLAVQGQRLIGESAQLAAESLDIAMTHATAPVLAADTPARTFRYREGGAERFERAQLIAQGCGRALIRTLRGWLMSIPVAVAAADCPASAATN